MNSKNGMNFDVEEINKGIEQKYVIRKQNVAKYNFFTEKKQVKQQQANNDQNIVMDLRRNYNEMQSPQQKNNMQYFYQKRFGTPENKINFNQSLSHSQQISKKFLNKILTDNNKKNQNDLQANLDFDADDLPIKLKNDFIRVMEQQAIKQNQKRQQDIKAASQPPTQGLQQQQSKQPNDKLELAQTQQQLQQVQQSLQINQDKLAKYKQKQHTNKAQIASLINEKDFFTKQISKYKQKKQSQQILQLNSATTLATLETKIKQLQNAYEQSQTEIKTLKNIIFPESVINQVQRVQNMQNHFQLSEFLTFKTEQLQKQISALSSLQIQQSPLSCSEDFQYILANFQSQANLENKYFQTKENKDKSKQKLQQQQSIIKEQESSQALNKKLDDFMQSTQQAIQTMITMQSNAQQQLQQQVLKQDIFTQQDFEIDKVSYKQILQIFTNLDKNSGQATAVKMINVQDCENSQGNASECLKSIIANINCAFQKNIEQSSLIQHQQSSMEENVKRMEFELKQSQQQERQINKKYLIEQRKSCDLKSLLLKAQAQIQMANKQKSIQSDNKDMQQEIQSLIQSITNLQVIQEDQSDINSASNQRTHSLDNGNMLQTDQIKNNMNIFYINLNKKMEKIQRLPSGEGSAVLRSDKRQKSCIALNNTKPSINEQEEKYQRGVRRSSTEIRAKAKDNVNEFPNNKINQNFEKFIESLDSDLDIIMQEQRQRIQFRAQNKDLQTKPSQSQSQFKNLMSPGRIFYFSPPSQSGSEQNVLYEDFKRSAKQNQCQKYQSPKEQLLQRQTQNSSDQEIKEYTEAYPIKNDNMLYKNISFYKLFGIIETYQQQIKNLQQSIIKSGIKNKKITKNNKQMTDKIAYQQAVIDQKTNQLEKLQKYQLQSVEIDLEIMKLKKQLEVKDQLIQQLLDCKGKIQTGERDASIDQLHVPDKIPQECLIIQHFQGKNRVLSIQLEQRLNENLELRNQLKESEQKVYKFEQQLTQHNIALLAEKEEKQFYKQSMTVRKSFQNIKRVQSSQDVLTIEQQDSQIYDTDINKPQRMSPMLQKKDSKRREVQMVTKADVQKMVIPLHKKHQSMFDEAGVHETDSRNVTITPITPFEQYLNNKADSRADSIVSNINSLHNAIKDISPIPGQLNSITNILLPSDTCEKQLIQQQAKHEIDVLKKEKKDLNSIISELNSNLEEKDNFIIKMKKCIAKQKTSLSQLQQAKNETETQDETEIAKQLELCQVERNSYYYKCITLQNKVKELQTNLVKYQAEDQHQQNIQESCQIQSKQVQSEQCISLPMPTIASISEEGGDTYTAAKEQARQRLNELEQTINELTLQKQELTEKNSEISKMCAQYQIQLIQVNSDVKHYQQQITDTAVSMQEEIDKRESLKDQIQQKDQLIMNQLNEIQGKDNIIQQQEQQIMKQLNESQGKDKITREECLNEVKRRMKVLLETSTNEELYEIDADKMEDVFSDALVFLLEHKYAQLENNNSKANSIQQQLMSQQEEYQNQKLIEIQKENERKGQDFSFRHQQQNNPKQQQKSDMPMSAIKNENNNEIAFIQHEYDKLSREELRAKLLSIEEQLDSCQITRDQLQTDLKDFNNILSKQQMQNQLLIQENISLKQQISDQLDASQKNHLKSVFLKYIFEVKALFKTANVKVPSNSTMYSYLKIIYSMLNVTDFDIEHSVGGYVSGGDANIALFQKDIALQNSSASNPKERSNSISVIGHMFGLK